MKTLAALLLSAVLLTQNNSQTPATPTASPWPGDSVYAHAGQLVSVGTRRLNLYCMGASLRLI